MSCKFSEYGTRVCQFFGDEIERFGCDEEGICICEDDDDPTEVC